MGGLFAKPKTPKPEPPTRLTPPEERQKAAISSVRRRDDELEGFKDTDLTGSSLGGGANSAAAFTGSGGNKLG
jgi:hypothetical protein